MAIPQNQKARKAAAKTAKRKAVVAKKLAAQRRELGISKPRHVDLAASPVADCLITKEFEDEGMASVLLSRKLSLGRYAVAMFLIDRWCLGVKGAFFDVMEGDDYEDYLADAQAQTPMEPADLSRARKLVVDAAAYGLSNGFSPPPGFADLERLFGDVVPGGEAFAFGDGGKPHYVIGPNDPVRVERYVLDVLEQKFGPDGYFVTYPLEDGDDAAS